MKKIDLRGDFVTQLSPQMRQAMARVEIGDEVFGKDQTVEQLEQLAAEKLGKEAALFVASGTMGNLVALLTHCRRGDEAILGDQSHLFLYETAGIAALGGIQPRTLINQADGSLAIEDIKNSIRGDNVHWPRTRVIALENTHNRCDGAPLTPAYLSSVYALAKSRGIAVHTDGARIFNAAVSLGLPVAQLCRPTDSISFCLSKGLGAPVGALLCGPQDFIAEARRQRTMVGGEMHGDGVLAAAGLVALETMVERLAEDHAHARYLAENLAEIPGIDLDPSRVKTNIVFFSLKNGMSAEELVGRVAREGILIGARGEKKLRALTRYGIERTDIDIALGAIRRALVN